MSAGPGGWPATRTRGWPARRCSTSRCRWSRWRRAWTPPTTWSAPPRRRPTPRPAALDGAETEALKASLGFGARGPGVAAASRGSAAQLKELERRQKSRATRLGRDSIDRALVDLAGLYRDALVLGSAPASRRRR